MYPQHNYQNLDCTDATLSCDLLILFRLASCFYNALQNADSWPVLVLCRDVPHVSLSSRTLACGEHRSCRVVRCVFKVSSICAFEAEIFSEVRLPQRKSRNFPARFMVCGKPL